MAALKGWNRFWFSPVPVRRLAAFRLLVATYACYDVAVNSHYLTRYARVDNAFWEPIFLFRALENLGVGRPGETLLGVVYIALIIALACGAIGLFTRAAFVAAAPLYIFWWGHYYSYGAVQHGRMSIVFAIAVMAIAPAGGAYSIDALRDRRRRARAGEPLPAPRNETDPLAGWALRVVGVFLIVTYLSAAFAKLKVSGIDWPTGGALEAALLAKGTGIGEMIAERPWLIHTLAASAFLLELTAFVVLFGGRIRDIWLLGITGFHIGSMLLLNISFFPFILTFACFYRIEDLTARLGRLVNRESVERIDVTYDGQCGLCVHTIALLDGLDWFGRLRFHDGSMESLDAMYATTEGRTYRGFEAFRRIAHSIPILWPAVAVGYLPGFARAGNAGYEFVARNRSRIGTCEVSCALPDRSGAATRS